MRLERQRGRTGRPPPLCPLAAFLRKAINPPAQPDRSRYRMKKTPWQESPQLFAMGNVRAIDGDTIAADVHVGLGHKAAERIRLKGWWAPEMHGPSAAYGQLAQKRLQAYLDSHICHLLAPGHRRDRYGRLIGSLWYLGRIVPPEQVLAELQLTEETHKAQRDAAKTPLAHLASTPVCQWPDDLIPPYGPASLQDEAFQ